MTKRKPVLVLFIIAAIFFIAGTVIFLIPTVIMPVAELKVSFLDLNKGIIDVFTGTNKLRNILSIAVSAVLFIIIPLIVHIRRKQTSVTVLLLLGALAILYVDLLIMSFSEIKADLLKQITENEEYMKKFLTDGLIFILGLGLIAVAGLLEFVIFIVDMVIRAKREPETVTAQAAREEVAEEPAPAKEEKEPEEEVAPAEADKEPEVVEEPKEEPVAVVEEPKPEEEPEEEEPEEEPEEEEAEEEVEEQPEEKAEPKKAPAKKAASKKPAKKAEPKKAAKKEPAKKAEPKKATRETTTIKKPRETQTIKKAEILTNEEGKQFAKAYHISQRKELNKWQVKGAGSDKALKLFDTQKEAIEYANELSAKNGAAVRVHSRAGKMRKA